MIVTNGIYIHNLSMLKDWIKFLLFVTQPLYVFIMTNIFHGYITRPEAIVYFGCLVYVFYLATSVNKITELMFYDKFIEA